MPAPLSGDGKLDLAAANAGSNSVSVLLGNGDGSFPAAAPSFGAGRDPYSVAGDFNRDGALDLAAANLLSDNVSVLINNTRH